jgi:hypothetical protein
MEFNNKLKPKKTVNTKNSQFRFNRKGAGVMSRKLFSQLEKEMDTGKNIDEALEIVVNKKGK